MKSCHLLNKDISLLLQALHSVYIYIYLSFFNAQFSVFKLRKTKKLLFLNFTFTHLPLSETFDLFLQLHRIHLNKHRPLNRKTLVRWISAFMPAPKDPSVRLHLNLST